MAGSDLYLYPGRPSVGPTFHNLERNNALFQLK